MPTLEDILNIMALLLYGEASAIGLTLVGEDKHKLQHLTVASSFTRSLYSSWILYFDEGEGSRSGFILEALLAYWLSWFRSEDGLKYYVLVGDSPYQREEGDDGANIWGLCTCVWTSACPTRRDL